jgi:uncharacterized membrane protein (DUF2068 family)
MSDRKDRKDRLLPVIAAFKLGKACLLFTVALAFRHLRHGDVTEILDQWARAVRIDPQNTIAHDLISKITGVPRYRLHELGIGTFFYGMLFAVEGCGLLLRKRWAEYMTVITTMTFLPLEIYELIFKPERKVTKAILLLLNLGILVYLVWNLSRQRRLSQEA